MATASFERRPPAGPASPWFSRFLGMAAASWMFIAFFVGFFLFWEYSIDWFGIPGYILPRPSEIVAKGSVDLPRLLYYTYITGIETVLGYVVAIVIAVPLGLAIAFSSILRRTIYPFFVSIEMTPKIAFAPLFIAWLGFGIASKVALATFIATFPIIVGTAAGLHAADENARMLFRTMGASRLQTLVKMKLPTGLPHFFTGLKIASVGVMAGVITGEFLGGGKGFGELIRIAASQLDTPRVFSLIIYLSLLGLATFGSVVWIQRRFVFWQKASVADGLT